MNVDCVQSMHMSAHIVSVHSFNYTFLVKLHVSSKFPIRTWKKYTLITPSGMTDAVCPAFMHTVSAICLWATVLV